MIQVYKALSFTLGIVIGFATLPSASAQFFATRGSMSVNPAPYSIAVGDFNQDGNQDMAVAAFLDSQVGVSLGNGDGTFQKAVYYQVGSDPESIALGDFNQDGQMDLAVANATGCSIGILLGNGDGTFQPQYETALTLCPTSIAAADFNGDQVLDLATIGVGTFSVVLGNGDGSFQAPLSFTPETIPDALGVGDFNGDGRLDVATAGEDFTSDHVDVFLGNGDGTFAAGLSYLVGSEPLAMVVADFRNVGKLDLAVADLLGGISVLLGNGDGTFQPTKTYPDSAPLAIATGDFNRDGKLDFVTSNDPDEKGIAGAYVFLGNGDGTFQPSVPYRQGKVDKFVAVSDFNGDKWPDLALADSIAFDVTVLLNTGVVSFSPTIPISFPAQLLNTTSSPKTVTLINSATTALSIRSITVQGSEFRLSSGTTCGSSVAPGASCKILTMFHPQTKGLKAGLLSVRDSASTKPQIIQLFGSGTIVTVAPTQLNFPNTPKGSQSEPQTVTVTNKGTVSLMITKVALGGEWPIDYFFTNLCPTQLTPGASCTVSVTFKPLDKGLWPATLTITDDGGGSPQTVTLTGRGI